MVIDQVVLMVSAVIKDKKGKVILLKRTDTKTFQDFWQLPEGKIDEKEKPEEALKREMKEELGSKISSHKLVSAIATPLETNNTKYLALRMVFQVSLKKSDIKLDEEHAEYRWLTLNEVKRLQLLPGTLESIESI